MPYSWNTRRLTEAGTTGIVAVGFAADIAGADRTLAAPGVRRGSGIGATVPHRWGRDTSVSDERRSGSQPDEDGRSPHIQASFNEGTLEEPSQRCLRGAAAASASRADRALVVRPLGACGNRACRDAPRTKFAMVSSIWRRRAPTIPTCGQMGLTPQRVVAKVHRRPAEADLHRTSGRIRGS